MSELITKLNFDLTNQTAAIEYYLDSQPVSEWYYEAETVTVEERTEIAEVTLEQALELDRVTQTWIGVIQRHFQPVIMKCSKFEYGIKKKATKVFVRLVVDGVGLVNDDFWSQPTGLITYNPRPALTLNWTDYITLWQGTHRLFNDAIINF